MVGSFIRALMWGRGKVDEMVPTAKLKLPSFPQHVSHSVTETALISTLDC